MALQTEPYLSACGSEVTAKICHWPDSSFFDVAHILVHHHFMRLLGGRSWTNSIGEGQNVAVKSANGGTRANYNIDTLFGTLTVKSIMKNQFIMERF